MGGSIGSIAATLVYWSDSAVQSVGWTQISDATSANAFADAIAAAARPFGGGTGMTNAVNFSAGLFDNDFEGSREVIDVSGDGSESVKRALAPVTRVCVTAAGRHATRSWLAATDRTINALWIDDRDFFRRRPARTESTRSPTATPT
ncbi:MAG: DUF1194 domain-containing protein [Halofilum sp. (in: g-proteobacteria)]|nr:DUF1194 domain-containing protein [Halofilum sp. (in: g-proteobacteria)]